MGEVSIYLLYLFSKIDEKKIMKMIKLFQGLVAKSETIVITTHIHPDADGIGSEIALCMALQDMGKKAVCVNQEPLMERYKYLDPRDVVISYATYQEQFKDSEIDLFIVTDTNSLERIGHDVKTLVQGSKNLLFVDHHPCPKELAAIHCIDTNMAATGELVGWLIESLGVPFNQELALPLYTSIIIDTSSFRYPTVSANTHLLISKLLATGIEPPKAYNYIYGTKQISYMQLLGIVLSSAESCLGGRISWMKLSEESLDLHDVDPEDTHGFINHLLILDQIEVACMFRQIGKMVKISFRSAGETDVGNIAQALGGGGHGHSAATLIEGQLDDVIKDTVEKLKIMLS